MPRNSGPSGSWGFAKTVPVLFVAGGATALLLRHLYRQIPADVLPSELINEHMATLDKAVQAADREAALEALLDLSAALPKSQERVSPHSCDLAAHCGQPPPASPVTHLFSHCCPAIVPALPVLFLSIAPHRLADCAPPRRATLSRTGLRFHPRAPRPRWLRRAVGPSPHNPCTQSGCLLQ